MNRLNQILRYPEKIPCDKRMHFIAGVVIATVLLAFIINLYIVGFIVLFIAFGVEEYQKITKSGTYDNLDAIAVCVGAIFPIFSTILR
jgi:hypothetical protein